MDAHTDREAIVATAREEADRMRAAIAGRRGSVPVSMTVAQFETLATLIERLAERCGAGERHPDSTARSAGEFRSWVPLQHLERAQHRIAACEAAVEEARSQLASREADNILLTSLAFGVLPAR